MFKRLSAKGKEVDHPYRYINNSISKGAQPEVTVWSHLIRAEALLKDQNKTTDDGDAVLPLPGGTTLNISELRKLLDLSLKIFGMANAQLVSTRKQNLKSYLHSDYQDLCDRKRPFTDFMFGTNLKTQIEDIGKLNKISTKLTSGSKKKSSSSWPKQQSRQRFLDKGKPQTYQRRGKQQDYYRKNKNRSSGYQNSQLQNQLKKDLHKKS